MSQEQEQGQEQNVDSGNNLLDNFAWDSDDVFNFDDPNGESDTTQNLGDVPNDEEQEQPEETGEENTEEIFDFGEDYEDTEYAEDEDEDESQESENLSVFSNIAKDLKEKELFYSDFNPEEIQNEEDFYALQEMEVHTRLEEAFNEFAGNLDDDAAAFIKFKQQGGNTADFLKYIEGKAGKPEGDLTDPNYQAQISSYYFQTVEGLDAQAAQERVEWLHSTGKLEGTAMQSEEKLTQVEQQHKQYLVQQAHQQNQERVQREAQYVENLKSHIADTNDINGYEVQDKNALLGFMTQRNVRIGEGQYSTGYEAALQRAINDPVRSILLAELLKNDFDFTSIEARARTMNARHVKSELNNTGGNLARSLKSKSKKNFADNF